MIKAILKKIVRVPKIKNFVYAHTLSPAEKKLLTFRDFGYLKELGWFNCLKTGDHLNEKGEHIPELTYSFIKILDERLNRSMSVLEFGIGFSSIYYSKKSKKLLIFETSEEWAKKIGKQLEDNSKIEMVTDLQDSINAVENLDEKYDMVIIDSDPKVRNEFVEPALKALSERGVIIFDDSHRDEFRKGMEILENHPDYKKIDFYGISPGSFNERSTTVFYRTNNVLNF